LAFESKLCAEVSNFDLVRALDRVFPRSLDPKLFYWFLVTAEIDLRNETEVSFLKSFREVLTPMGGGVLRMGTPLLSVQANDLWFVVRALTRRDDTG
jgi:hypothetical protein